MKSIAATLSPRRRAESFLRSLPYPLTRALIVADLGNGIVNPLWGWWLYRRWTGKRIDFRKYWPIHKRALDFAWKHVRNWRTHRGLFATAWRSPPSRHTICEERIDHRPRGSCGTCRNCCTTFWLPPSEQVACPFLEDQGCSIYAGVLWDYFNCGRYPINEADLRLYDCSRFSTDRRSIPVA